MAKTVTDPRLALAKKLAAAQQAVVEIEAEISRLTKDDQALVETFHRLLAPAKVKKPRQARVKKTPTPAKPTKITPPKKVAKADELD